MIESHFDLLLQAARSQPDTQRLLFVFAAATLAADASAEEQKRFDAGGGGALEPVMCVDKDPHAVADFAGLAAEARHMGQDWRVVFVAGLSGSGPRAPSPSQTGQALDDMVEAVRQGGIARFAAYDAHGEPLCFW